MKHELEALAERIDMKIVSVEQIQRIEESANKKGVTYDQMMQNAGSGLATWILNNLSLKKGVLGLIGSGNNGGDTLIALKVLAEHGVRTTAFLVRDRGEDPLVEGYIHYGGQVVDISQNTNLGLLAAAIHRNTVILDGIIGTGFRLPLREGLRDLMGNIQNICQNHPEALIIAVDCPSGTDCDSGEVSECTLKAGHCMCIAAIKQGLLKHPAREYAGRLHTIHIGINDLQEHIPDNLPEMIDQGIARRCLPDRPNLGHKGTFGTTLVIAGTEAFTGAAYLTAKAAYRSGCGLVDVATLRSVYSTLAGRLIEAVWTVLPDIDGGYDRCGVNLVESKLCNADSLVVGPGLGLLDSTRAFVESLLSILPKAMPTLLDADGLKILSSLDHWWEQLPKNTILTPHPGEMAVLSGLRIDEIQSDRWRVAREYAMKWRVVLILKGAVTVVAKPDGMVFINPISDSALATAGSGDVLSGIIGGLLAQDCSPKEASIAGVWLHSQAGLRAKKQQGTAGSVTSLDILEGIAGAFQKTTSSN